MSTEGNILQALARPIVFQVPRRLTAPPSWAMHAPLAMWLIDFLRPSVFVELGTYSGTSYCAFCQAVQELQLLSKCYAVDTWRGDPHASMYGEEVLQELSSYHDANYASFSRLVREDFDSALSHFADSSIDLLHIDGYHTYDAVKHDFESWRPKLSNRGVVLFHDTNVYERDFGVAQLWSELKLQYQSIEVLHGHGLGILLVGSEVPAGFRNLADRLRDSSADLLLFQAFFAHLGRACLLEVQDSQIGAEVRQLEARVLDLEGQNSQARVQMQRMADRAGELEADRAKLMSHCSEVRAEKEQIRQNLNQEIARLVRELREERAKPKGMLAPLRIMKRAVVGPRSE